MNLPNKLSVLRICLIPVFMALFFITQIPYNYILSAVVFLIAASTDFLDGYIARKNNLVTNLGKFLDPIADKVLVSTALVLMLTVPHILPKYFGGICVSIILARELMIGGFRTVAASRGLVLAADKLGKIKTFFQDTAIVVLLVAGESFFPSLKFDPLCIVGQVLLGAAALLTIISGINYIVKNIAVLKDEKK